MPVAYGCFNSLFQGDHAGVEVATGRETFAPQAGPVKGPWQALVIDDFFSVSAEPLTSFADKDKGEEGKALLNSQATQTSFAQRLPMMLKA